MNPAASQSMPVQRTGIPTGKIDLIEPSLADVLVAVAGAPGVSERTKRHWSCSIRQVAKSMEKPPEAVPARWTSARHSLARLDPADVRLNPKTLANHKSNVRAALLWFGQVADVPRRGAPFDADWEHLRAKLSDLRLRARLSPLMRYCSAKGITPSSVTEGTLDDYMRYRAATTALSVEPAARRSIARAWNGCARTVQGWPDITLAEPPVKSAARPAWEDFPKGLQVDLTRYLNGLTKLRRTFRGRRIRPCKPSTIRRCRAELTAAARTAVQEGVLIDKLDSLAALLHPEVAEKVLDAYWKADGEEPKVYTIDLGWKFLSIARETGCLPEEDLERLEDLRSSLDVYRHGDMTEKNKAVVRQVLSGDCWVRVLNLPATLLRQARFLRERAPIKAAVTAQLAAAIAILTLAPVRLGNLIKIRLDENLTRPGGSTEPYTLVFPRYDVKNRVPLEFPLDAELTALIEEYVNDFRPLLLRGFDEQWLFPGESGGCKDAKTLSEQITRRIQKTVGLTITAHQFRHAAAAMWLKHNPGDYETVRRTLGHSKIQTTINFYCGLETTQANKRFGDLVRAQMNSNTNALP